MKEVNLESGVVLKITPAPFAEALELTKAIAEEIKGVTIDPQSETINMIKEAALTLVASDKIEGKVRQCMERCVYGDARLSQGTIEEIFEDTKARGDYFKVFQEVLMENVGPFMKSLYAEFLSKAKELEKLAQA